MPWVKGFDDLFELVCPTYTYSKRKPRLATLAQNATPAVTSDPGWDARDSKSAPCMLDEEDEPWTR